MYRVLALLVVSIVFWGGCAVEGEQIEVSVAADGLVVVENDALEADSGGFSVKIQDARTKTEVSMAQEMENQRRVDLQSESDVVTLIATLQQELAAVEQMVKLQDKKLQVLEKMRRLWLQEQQQMQLQQEGDVVRRRTGVEGVGRRLDVAIAEAVGEAQEKDFDAYFVERVSMTLEGAVADVKVMKIHATSTVELIAIAFVDGVVAFRTSSGEELLRVSTEREGVKSIALTSQDNQPCLVVAYEAPVINLYAFNLTEKDHEHGMERGSQYANPSPLTISTGPKYGLSVAEHEVATLSGSASAVAIARSSRHLVVAVAQVGGTIDFLALNGTSLRQIQTNATINAMETRRNLLAFSNGTNVVVSSMTRVQGSIFHACPGSSAIVSSITFDALHPDIMYAGTHKGEVLVFAVNAVASAEGQGCRLLSRSTIMKNPRDFNPVVLATTKMYVIAAGPQDITIFNVSISQKHGASLTRVCADHLRKTTDLTQDLQANRDASLLAIAFSEGMMGSHLAFVTESSGESSKLVLFHSLLPDEKEQSDFQWTTFLYAGVVLVAVVGSQLFVRCQRQSSVNPWDSIGKPHDMPYGKYGGFKNNERASDFDGEDFGRYNSLSDELRRKIAQAKRGTSRRPVDDEADY